MKGHVQRILSNNFDIEINIDLQFISFHIESSCNTAQKSSAFSEDNMKAIVKLTFL